MQQTWKDIFRITQDDENNFDTQHSEHIETYIQIQQHRTTSYNTTDTTRLDNLNFHTRPMTVEEVKKHLSRFKKKLLVPLKLIRQYLKSVQRRPL